MFVFAGATLDGFPELYGPRLLRHRDSIIDFSFFFSFLLSRFLLLALALALLLLPLPSSSSRSSCLLPSPPPTKLRWQRQRASTCMQSDTICIEECAYMPIYIYTLYRIHVCVCVCACCCCLSLFSSCCRVPQRKARGSKPAAKQKWAAKN